MRNPHKGSDFDNFLKDEEVFDQVEATALKRVIAYEIVKLMNEEHITKRDMAEKLHTSRTALDRLLDPDNTSITLHTLVKVTHVLKRKLRLSFQ